MYSATSAESLSLGINSSRSAAPPSSSEGQRRETDDQKRRTGTKPETRFSASPAFRESGCPIEQLLRARLQVEPGVLVGLVARNGGDALHEIEDALRFASFLGQD